MKRPADHPRVGARDAAVRQPTRPHPSRRLLYSVEEAAELLGIGRTFMFHLVASGEIDSFKIGNRRKIHREALEAYVNRLRTEQIGASSSPADLQFHQDQVDPTVD